MHFKELETEQKLRGAYYTPDWLADFVARWLNKDDIRSIMEPSCGDGAFIRVLNSRITNKPLSVFGMDINPDAINQCAETSYSDNLSVSVVCEDYLGWAIQSLRSENVPQFDAVCGNPPFIRYQYLDKEQQGSMQQLFSLLGLKFTKHTNIWVAFLLSSVRFLRPGGYLAMVIPSEIIHVLYAAGAREYLAREAEWIHIIDPEDLWFDDASQGTVLLFLQKRQHISAGSSLIAITPVSGQSFTQRNMSDIIDETSYLMTNRLAGKWTMALLTAQEVSVWNKVLASKEFAPLGEVANVTVGVVTGANDFFCVSDEVVSKYGLQKVVMPMFRRSEHAPGVLYDRHAHRQNKANGKPVNFLYFESEADAVRHADYLCVGVDDGLPKRYKCRVRKPWYKVPSVWAAPLAMFSMIDKSPRLIYNAMGAVTTDTALRIIPKEGVDPKRLAYCFVNTVTALSAELEGRSYGGGVLELIPSETNRLMVPYYIDAPERLAVLHACVLENGIMEAVCEQDAAVLGHSKSLSKADIAVLHGALLRLQARRRRAKT